MTISPNLALPYIEAAQAQKHVTHNEAIRRLDALVQVGVLDRHLTAPPGSPAEGDRFIVAAPAAASWAGHETEIAAWQDGAWEYYTPRPGWVVWIADEGVLAAWDGADWATVAEDLADGLQELVWLGINATADATNRLSLSSSASLFNHEGSGHRLKVNKSTADDTASLLFQTGFSARAEMGTAGDDDFRVKVSPDGLAWHEAIVVGRDTGHLGIGTGPTGALLTVEPASGSPPSDHVLRIENTDPVAGLGDFFLGVSGGINPVAGVPHNPVLFLGYNMATNLAPAVAGESACGVGIEGHYEPAEGTEYNEVHLYFYPKADGQQHRAMSWRLNKNQLADWSVLAEADLISVKEPAAAEPFFQLTPSQLRFKPGKIAGEPANGVQWGGNNAEFTFAAQGPDAKSFGLTGFTDIYVGSGAGPAGLFLLPDGSLVSRGQVTFKDGSGDLMYLGRSDFQGHGSGHVDISFPGSAQLRLHGQLGLQGFPVAAAPAGLPSFGGIFYCSDGDSGAPCLAVWDGTDWRRVALGAPISAT